MIKIEELGVFNGHDYETYTPIEFDWSGRQLFLKKIKCLEYIEIGSSNYSYDQIGNYHLIFQINAGDGNHSIKGGEDYYFIIRLEVSEWYRDENDISNDLMSILSKYPIIDDIEVINAFRQRKYYR